MRQEHTLRWRVEGLHHFDAILASGRQPVMAFWHGRILPATFYFRRRGIVVITSENFDGEWIARIIERFGYGTARGSTTRGGRKALLQLVRDMEEGKPAGFTLDGPRGPARVAQPGAIGLRVAWPGIRCCRSTSRPAVALDDEELGSDADPEAVQHRGARRRRAAGGAARGDRRADGIGAARAGAAPQALETRARDVTVGRALSGPPMS